MQTTDAKTGIAPESTSGSGLLASNGSTAREVAPLPRPADARFSGNGLSEQAGERPEPVGNQEGDSNPERVRGLLADEDPSGIRGGLNANGIGSEPAGKKGGGLLSKRRIAKLLVALTPFLSMLLGIVMLASCINSMLPFSGSSGIMGSAANGAMSQNGTFNGKLPRVSVDENLADLFSTASESESDDEMPEYPTYVATFFGSNEDWTDTLYASDDCQTFKAIGKVPNGQRDPCIMFHDGRFWVVTCLNDEDGHLWLRVSSSEDLKTWVGPTKNGPFSLDRIPRVGGALYDVVAPEWFQDTDGSLHVIVSCGFWGACHGQDTNDWMEAYMLDVSSLTMSGGECRLSASGPARWMSVNADGADRIDGTINNVNGTYYLTIKRTGLYMELWKNTSLSPSGWVRLRDCSLYGFEAPCVFEVDGTWHMLADGVPDIEPYGTRMWTASSIDGQWNPTPIHFLREDGSEVGVVRHGTVLPLNKPGQGKAFKTVKQSLPPRNGTGGQQDGSLNAKQQAVISACKLVPSPGAGKCAQWVGDVYERANVGVSFRGHAYQWYYECCNVSAPHYGGTVKTDANRSTLKPGMVIAVPSSSSGTAAGAQFGHVGIYIGNGQVMHNIGSIDTCSVQDWITTYGRYADVGWGWPAGMK